MLLDFQNLTRTGKPNDALALPSTWDDRDRADLRAPVFRVAPDRLREAVLAIASREPRTVLVHLDEAAQQAEFEQRSALFGFRDTITVGIFGVDGASSLAIYSRSNLGYSDLGVNRRRVRRWLQALGQELGADVAAGSRG